MWHCVDFMVGTSVSNEHAASYFRVQAGRSSFLWKPQYVIHIPEGYYLISLDKLNNSHPQRTKRAVQGHRQEFYPRTINLTNIKFTKEEQELLHKRLQYNILQTGKINWTNLVVEMEQALE